MEVRPGGVGLVTQRDGLLTQRQLPIPLLTRLNVTSNFIDQDQRATINPSYQTKISAISLDNKTRSSADADKPARRDVRYIFGSVDSWVLLHLLQLPKSLLHAEHCCSRFSA